MKVCWTDYRTWRAAAFGLAVLACAVALAGGLGAWRTGRALEGASTRPSTVSTGLAGAGGAVVLATSGAWGAFEGDGEGRKAATADGALAERYRLAGVFMVFQGAEARDSSQTRCAILDDVREGGQLLAEEGEWAGDVRVVRIENEYVLLGDGEHEEMVFLAPPAIGTGGARRDAGAASGAGAAPAILETNRFGARVGDARWEISRAELMKYAQEVMDDPRRVSAMYLGMEPDYDGEHAVAGYRLNTSCGEAEFYAQVGFQDGDVVRRVNSIKMTSQRRAEFMLSQFFEGQLGTFVFDIERNGEPMKLIYMLR